MANKLTKFKIIDPNISTLVYDGKRYAVDQLTDKQAEMLVGRTHVLERIEEASALPVTKAKA